MLFSSRRNSSSNAALGKACEALRRTRRQAPVFAETRALSLAPLQRQRRPTAWRTWVLSVPERDSQLEQPRLPGGVTPPARAASVAPTGTLFGAVALITGSTVGAGMLALPAVTAPAGFAPTAAGLVGLWGVLLLEALLMAEVNLSLLDANAAEDGSGGIVTLRQMAERTLGKPGKVVPLIYLLLSYCLLVAYLAKAAEVLDYFVGAALPPPLGAATFVAATAAIFLVGGSNTADRINQALTSVLLALFGVIVASGMAQSDVGGTVAQGAACWTALAPAAPIMFLSLVYHDLVPLICSYLGGDRKLVKSALLFGSLVPLAMFVSWEAVALSLLPGGLTGAAGGGAAALQVGLQLGGAGDALQAVALQGAAEHATAPVVADAAGGAVAVDPLQLFVRRSGPFVGSAVQGFSFLAVLTSFIGTVMGLSETLRTEVPSIVREGGKLLLLRGGGGSSCSEPAGQEAEADESCSADWESAAVPTAAAAKAAPVMSVLALPFPAANTTSGSAASSSSVGDRGASGSSVVSPGGSDHEDDGGSDGGSSVGELGFGSDPGHILALALTLGPPLAFTANNPDAFVSVLSLAGGYGMTLLYGVLPPLMAWNLREQAQRQKSDSDAAAPADLEPLVPGGIPVLAALLAAALAIEVSRLAADAGLALGFVSPLDAAASLLGAFAATVAAAAAAATP